MIAQSAFRPLFFYTGYTFLRNKGVQSGGHHLRDVCGRHPVPTKWPVKYARLATRSFSIVPPYFQVKQRVRLNAFSHLSEKRGIAPGFYLLLPPVITIFPRNTANRRGQNCLTKTRWPGIESARGPVPRRFLECCSTYRNGGALFRNAKRVFFRLPTRQSTR